MYPELGEQEWFRTVETVSSYYLSKPDRGLILTQPPDELNLRPVRLIDCVEHAAMPSRTLLSCRTELSLVRNIDGLLRNYRHLLDREWQQRLPLEGVICDKKANLFEIALVILRRVGSCDNGNAAVLSLISYALIGLGVKRIKRLGMDSECRICWFRNRRPGSKYCFFHQYSHLAKGPANRYAQRLRAKRVKELYPQREADLRRRFHYYLILLDVPREEWLPIFEANVVSEMSVKWLQEILLDCPNVRDVIFEAINPYVVRGEWREVFNELRLRIDPYDTKTNLDFWCAKLLEAEAWIGAERHISGQWVFRDVVGDNGQILRSGQHVGGVRGPKESTKKKMARAIDIAMQGGDRNAIAIDLAVSVRTLRQWEKRHVEFCRTLSFYLKRVAV